MNSLLKYVALLAAIISVLQAMPFPEKASVLRKGVGDIWSNCSKSTDPAKILSVTITPDPPEKGKPLTVEGVVSLSETVTGGSIAAKVKYGIITIFNKELDLCDIAKQANSPCPVSNGTHTLIITESIPDIGGHITGNAQVKDQNGKELACINLDFHIV